MKLTTGNFIVHFIPSRQDAAIENVKQLKGKKTILVF
jgi:hypothetical protein